MMPAAAGAVYRKAGIEFGRHRGFAALAGG
jgi:hypothetical protein